MTIEKYTDRELALRARVAELEALINGGRKQEPIGFVESAVRGAGGFHACFQSGVFVPAGTQLYAAPVVAPDVPELTVVLRSYPESNGKRNWTALLKRKQHFEGLAGNAGGITVAYGERWNRVAYEAERVRFLLGQRATEPDIIQYGKDASTQEEWTGTDDQAMGGAND